MEGQLKRVAAYLRCSARDAAEVAESIMTQLKGCLELAQKCGLWIDPELVHRERRGGSDRTEFRRLMQAATDGGMDVVIVQSLDRLSRDPSEVMKLLQELDQLGVEVLLAFPRKDDGHGG